MILYKRFLIKNGLIFSLFLVGILFINSCKKESKEPKISFYYWKPYFSLSKADKQLIEENETEKLYIHYYDVVMENNKPLPTTVLVGETFPKKKKIVPVIIIKNDVFEKLNHENIDTLANRMVAFTLQISESRQVRPLEIQFDCDWTEKTKEPYFYFLKKYQGLSGQKILVNIRLHQIKYSDRVGVPPASRGVFMYYNIGKIINPISQNIVDNRALTIKNLAYAKEYPLPLDVALPIFSWGMQIRNQQVVGLLDKVNNFNFQNKDTFQKVTKSSFIAKKNFFKKGYEFQENDVIKIEIMTDKKLLTMATDLSENMKQPQEIIFYHLDSLNYSKYQKGIFQKVKHIFN